MEDPFRGMAENHEKRISQRLGSQHGADKYKAAAYTGAGSEFSGEICLSEGRGKKGVAGAAWERYMEKISRRNVHGMDLY